MGRKSSEIYMDKLRKNNKQLAKSLAEEKIKLSNTVAENLKLKSILDQRDAWIRNSEIEKKAFQHNINTLQKVVESYQNFFENIQSSASILKTQTAQQISTIVPIRPMNECFESIQIPTAKRDLKIPATPTSHVRPMVHGCTIQRPVINLQRIPTSIIPRNGELQIMPTRIPHLGESLDDSISDTTESNEFLSNFITVSRGRGNPNLTSNDDSIVINNLDDTTVSNMNESGLNTAQIGLDLNTSDNDSIDSDSIMNDDDRITEPYQFNAVSVIAEETENLENLEPPVDELRYEATTQATYSSPLNSTSSPELTPLSTTTCEIIDMELTSMDFWNGQLPAPTIIKTERMSEEEIEPENTPPSSNSPISTPVKLKEASATSSFSQIDCLPTVALKPLTAPQIQQAMSPDPSRLSPQIKVAPCDIIIKSSPKSVKKSITRTKPKSKTIQRRNTRSKRKIPDKEISTDMSSDVMDTENKGPGNQTPIKIKRESANNKNETTSLTLNGSFPKVALMPLTTPQIQQAMPPVLLKLSSEFKASPLRPSNSNKKFNSPKPLSTKKGRKGTESRRTKLSEKIRKKIITETDEEVCRTSIKMETDNNGNEQNRSPRRTRGVCRKSYKELSVIRKMRR